MVIECSEDIDLLTGIQIITQILQDVKSYRNSDKSVTEQSLAQPVLQHKVSGRIIQSSATNPFWQPAASRAIAHEMKQPPCHLARACGMYPIRRTPWIGFDECTHWKSFRQGVVALVQHPL